MKVKRDPDKVKIYKFLKLKKKTLDVIKELKRSQYDSRCNCRAK